MKRILFLACALALVVPSLCLAQSQVTTTIQNRYQVWPVITASGAHTIPFMGTATRDTLAHITARTPGTPSDSGWVFTDSIFIEGARIIALMASSTRYTGSTYVIGDSLRVPIAWIRGVDAPGRWEQVPTLTTNRHLPVMQTGAFPGWTTAMATTETPVTLWSAIPQDGGSGTLTPITGMWWKWRIGCADLRDYLNTATVPVPGQSGNLNFYVQTVKY